MRKINMNRDEKDKYFSNSLMPKPESLRGKKVALFGLSANPPTGYQGHSGIVRYLAEQNLLSEIWILPVYQHMFIAKKGLLAFEHRMAMCKLCMETSDPANMTTVRVLPLEKIVLEYFASKKSDVTRTGTIDVLDFLHLLYGDSLEISLVLGTDTYNDLKAFKWKESKRIMSTVSKIHVLHRKQAESATADHSSSDSSCSGSVQWHDVPGLSSVSSTLVRGLRPSNLSFWPFTTLLGDPLYAQVHPAVYYYMKRHRLFGFSTSYLASIAQPWSFLAAGVLVLVSSKMLWTSQYSKAIMPHINSVIGSIFSFKK